MIINWHCFNRWHQIPRFRRAKVERSEIACCGDVYSFSRQLKINSSKKNKSALSLSVEWGDAETAARIANEYSALVDRETVKEFASNLRNAVSNRVRDIEYTIASKRKMAKQRRKDKVSQLVEADRIQQEYLEEKIVLLKAHALTDREDRIARLQEADLIKRANIQEKISLFRNPHIDRPHSPQPLKMADI